MCLSYKLVKSTPFSRPDLGWVIQTLCSFAQFVYEERKSADSKRMRACLAGTPL